MNKTPKSFCPGYIALVVMMVVSVVGVLIAVYILQSTIDMYKQSIVSTADIHATAHAQSCAEIALQKIWEAGDVVNISGSYQISSADYCSYSVVSNSVGAQIQSVGYSKNIVRRILVQIAIDTKITVVSWRQVAVF